MATVHVEPREDDVYNEKNEEDWLFDSVKSYNHLHIYELQDIPTAIDFISKEALCITCEKEEGGSEILELHIPDKLTAKDPNKLSKDRDFSVVSGGFHNKTITSILCVPGTRTLVNTEERSNSIGVWKLGDDKSDLCSLQGHIENPKRCPVAAKTCVFGSANNLVAFGSTVADICIADINTQKVTHALNLSGKENLEHLSYVNETTLFACDADGQAWLVDTRESGDLSLTLPKVKCKKVKVTWSCDTQQQKSFLRVNSSGEGDIGDFRNCSTSQEFQLALPNEKTTFCFKSRVSPGCNLITLSGFNGDVQVYDTSQLKNTELPLEPCFTHSGHSACSQRPRTVSVLTAWFPWEDQLIFSAANDGSLHAWDFCQSQQQSPT